MWGQPFDEMHGIAISFWTLCLWWFGKCCNEAGHIRPLRWNKICLSSTRRRKPQSLKKVQQKLNFYTLRILRIPANINVHILNLVCWFPFSDLKCALAAPDAANFEVSFFTLDAPLNYPHRCFTLIPFWRRRDLLLTFGLQLIGIRSCPRRKLFRLISMSQSVYYGFMIYFMSNECVV